MTELQKVEDWIQLMDDVTYIYNSLPEICVMGLRPNVGTLLAEAEFFEPVQAYASEVDPLTSASLLDDIINTNMVARDPAFETNLCEELLEKVSNTHRCVFAYVDGTYTSIAFDPITGDIGSDPNANEVSEYVSSSTPYPFFCFLLPIGF